MAVFKMDRPGRVSLQTICLPYGVKRLGQAHNGLPLFDYNGNAHVDIATAQRYNQQRRIKLADDEHV